MKGNIFDKDFFPTPIDVIERMISGLDLSGKVILEPSAGKGNIVDILKEQGADVLTCEKHPDLASIVKGKSTFLKNDFLKVTAVEVSHVDFIIMNPPFSMDSLHIKHAYEIAPPGCQIIALANWQTVENSFSRDRRQLEKLISENGTVENLGSVFSDSERTTDVEVALINLYKPKVDSEEMDYESYFSTEDIDDSQAYGIIAYSEIREIVNRYVAAIKIYDSVVASGIEMQQALGGFFGEGLSFTCTKEGEEITKLRFKKDLQKQAWKWVFDKMDMGKYVTSSLLAELNKFVEQQQNIPFTEHNIYRMIEMVVGTHSGRMDQVLLEVFDSITKHYHDNRFAVEGWKTNDHYLVNEKLIFPYVVNFDYGRMQCSYNGNKDKIEELNKALCHLTGEQYSDQGSLYRFLNNTSETSFDHYNSASKRKKHSDKYHYYLKRKAKWIDDMTEEEFIENEINSEFKAQKDYRLFQTGVWYDWGFFMIKGFKKGTLHLKFKDRKVWQAFNMRVAELKGFPLAEAI